MRTLSPPSLSSHVSQLFCSCCCFSSPCSLLFPATPEQKTSVSSYVRRRPTQTPLESGRRRPSNPASPRPSPIATRHINVLPIPTLALSDTQSTGAPSDEAVLDAVTALHDTQSMSPDAWLSDACIGGGIDKASLASCSRGGSTPFTAKTFTLQQTRFGRAGVNTIAYHQTAGRAKRSVMLCVSLWFFRVRCFQVFKTAEGLSAPTVSYYALSISLDSPRSGFPWRCHASEDSSQRNCLQCGLRADGPRLRSTLFIKSTHRFTEHNDEGVRDR